MKNKNGLFQAVVIPVMVSALLCLSVPAAMAHDWWLDGSQEKGFEIVMGHMVEGVAQGDPYEPERVVQAAGHLENKKWLPVSIGWKPESAGAYLEVQQPFSVLTALVYNKYWMHTTQGWQNKRITGLKDVVKEGHSYKFMKHIESWHPWVTEPLNQRFEIVPLKNPAALAKGESLQVRLYFMGQQIHEAALTQASGAQKLTTVKTDDRFSVTLSDKNFQLISAKIEVPVKDRQIIWYGTSLTFNMDALKSD